MAFRMTHATQPPRLASPSALLSRLRHCLQRILPAAIMLAVSGMPATGQAQGLNAHQLVQAELRPGWQTERGTHMAALHLRLADGWKTYWRIPGEAGIAPRLDWSRSQNLASVISHWPRPMVFDQNGFRSIGYDGELVLPLEISARDHTRPMALNAQVTIGICRETCVPVDLDLSVALRGEGQDDPLIRAALSRRAEAAAGAGLRNATCRIQPDDRGARLQVRVTLPPQGADEHMVLELPGSGYWVSDSETWREGNDLVAQAHVRAPGRGAVAIDRSMLALTVLSPTRMLTHRGCTGG